MACQDKKIRLGVLLSGGGRTMVNLAECIGRGELDAEIVAVVSSRSTVAGVERAQKLGIQPEVVRKIDFPDVDEFSEQIAAIMDTARVDLVVLCGYLCFWKVPKRYENRVMNIHPSLLPSFGGQGMWGHHVHEAVLETGCKVSGPTVHFVTNEYDSGPIIIQRCCPVYDTDNASSLGERVFEQECLAYPEAIRLFAAGQLTVRNGVVCIDK